MATLASHPPPFPHHPAPSIEVRCAGCDGTLEVDQGLTEFVCPDCETPQSLPPELLPRKRRALPLHRGGSVGGVDSGKTQLPCACCNALLNVPHGLARFSCPKCGAELAVDNERLRGYLARSLGVAAVSEVTPVAPAAVRLPQQRPLEVEPYVPYDIVARSTPALSASTAFVDKVLIASSREPVSSINVNNNIARPPLRTPAFTCVNAEQNDTPIPLKEPCPTSVSAEQVEGEAASIPTTVSKRGRKSKKQARKAAVTTYPSLDETEPSLRRSKRLAKPPVGPNTSKQNPNKDQINQKKDFVPAQSQPSQSQLGHTEDSENQLDPQDIARHYNDLFPMDPRQLFADSTAPHIEPHSNTSADQQLDPDSDPTRAAAMVPAEISSDEEEEDEKEDETYMAESDCSGNSSNNELEENEHNPAMSEALLRAQKTIGSYRKIRESKHRGPTRCLDVWNRPDDDPIEIEFNHLGQPIGKEAATLKFFLGTIARDGKLTPLNFLDWKAVPTEYKDTIWFIVKSKFKLEHVRKKYIIKSTGRIWSNWKSVLKRRHYDVHDNDEARLADVNKRIVPEQWPFLVRFWSSEEGQKRSANGRQSRKLVKAMHTLGTKSYARLREEERLRKPDKQEPSRAEMFILTRTRKDGTPVNEESAQIIARLQEELKEEEPSKNTNPRNDILAKVLGDKKSYMLTYGLLPNKPDLWNSGPSEEKQRIVAEARRLADEESKPLRDKIDTMEKRHKEMEEEMQRMKNTIAQMQRMISAAQHQPNQPGPTLSFWSEDR